MSSTDQDIEDFLAAEEIAWQEMDLRTMYESADLFRYDPLLCKPWTDLHTLPMIRAVEKSGLPMRDIARLSHNPSLVRGNMLFDLLIAKEARAGIEAYGMVFDFYSAIAKAACPEDPYTLRGTNRIHTAEELSALREKCAPGDAQVARELGKLSNACYSLSHGLYSDMNPQIVYDNIGPYYDGAGSMFVLKIFHNLKSDIWPETAKLPYDSLDIGMYMEGVMMTMDATTHATYTGNQIAGLRSWWCEGNGQRLSLEEIIAVRRAIEACAIEVYAKTKAWTTEERKRVFCYQKAWGYKSLFDALGLDWNPHPLVLEAMKGGDLYDNWDIDPDTGTFRIPLREVLDPRHEIPQTAFLA